MKHILFADDEVDLRSMMAAMLARHGYDAVETGGGEAALDAYVNARHSAEPFDLIILDLAMPYTNGFEVAQKIRDSGDDETPIIFMTASTRESELETRAAKLTPIPICFKPFKLEGMMAQIESVLN